MGFHSPLIRPLFLGGGGIRGVPLGSHDINQLRNQTSGGNHIHITSVLLSWYDWKTRATSNNENFQNVDLRLCLGAASGN